MPIFKIGRHELETNNQYQASFMFFDRFVQHDIQTDADIGFSVYRIIYEKASHVYNLQVTTKINFGSGSFGL